jgi:hypothetical protein
MKLTKLQINKIKKLDARLTKLDYRFQNRVVGDFSILVDDLYSIIEEILECERDEK